METPQNHQRYEHWRAGMTLVEVMMSFAVFAIAIVGALGAIIFSLNSVDSARTEAQVTQVLVNEMEAMRMRRWNTDVELVGGTNPLVLKSIKTLISEGATPAGILPASVEEVLGKYEAGGTLPVTRPPIKQSTFVPFAVYGYPPALGNSVATVGKEIASSASLARLRTEAVSSTNVPQYTRYLAGPFILNAADQDAAVIILLVKWKDSRGDHARTLSTVVPSKGFTHD